MASYDFSAVRLFVQGPITAGRSIACDRDQANYLANVMRLSEGDFVHVFDGLNGEWRARVERPSKKALLLSPTEQVRAQTPPGDLKLLFAPLKHARLDYMVQKAVEMGVSSLHPVQTQHTQVSRINPERMQANAVEAAEQCGILAVAECHDLTPLATALDALGPDRLLVFCDEDAPVADAVAALKAHSARAGLAVVIGPEGGFSAEERRRLSARPNTVALSLGPRILRADTAAVAALAVVQAVLGDWR